MALTTKIPNNFILRFIAFLFFVMPIKVKGKIGKQQLNNKQTYQKGREKISRPLTPIWLTFQLLRDNNLIPLLF
ncbi:hypothetical protein NIB75_23080 [Bacteroides uniformis]|nr:hypothetical protein [Bacteroides uniformis]